MYIEVTGKRIVYRTTAGLVVRKRGWLGEVPDPVFFRNKHACRAVEPPAETSELDALQIMYEMENETQTASVVVAEELSVEGAIDADSEPEPVLPDEKPATAKTGKPKSTPKPRPTPSKKGRGRS